jgi:hypothetical protein
MARQCSASASEYLTPARAFLSVVSSTPDYAAPGALTVPAAANFFVAAVIIGLFVLAAALGAERKDITQGFDEVAHASYVAHIQHTGDPWPALENMRLLDPQTFQFTGNANYLNHPPPFYALLAAAGPKLEGHPDALLVHRLLGTAITTAGLAALLGLGLAARLSRQEFYAYAVPLASIPVLVPLAGAVNNDDLAFLGGALATLGIWQLAAAPVPTLPRSPQTAGKVIWLAVALFGVVAAGWAKLTGLLLTGTMVSAVIVYLLWRKRLRWTWAIAAAAALVLAAAPYLVYIVQYGSPTPQTPAQIALIENGARAAGWADLPRQSFPGYLAYFVTAFVVDWMPALGVRSAFNYALLIIPVTALACALVGLALSLRRLWRRQETALDVVIVCGAIALAATFAVHIVYSYGRHVATGWLMDAYPRYYLPLVAIVPLSGLSFLAAVEAPRWRAGLLAFLVAGPVLFRIFGAPLG